ncbi:MAG: hypothetical protein RI891_670, partial [Gemmatimonadota bacterium]
MPLSAATRRFACALLAAAPVVRAAVPADLEFFEKKIR